MSYGVRFLNESQSYRYLVKFDGQWVFFNTPLRRPWWNPEVSDVIWLKADNMIASWWVKRNGVTLDHNEKVDNAELSLYLLGASDHNV